MQLLVSTQLINSSQSNWAISQGNVKNATSLKPPPRHMYVYHISTLALLLLDSTSRRYKGTLLS